MSGELAEQITLCARHPETRALGICSRCGSYYCAACHKKLAGRVLCGSCLEIPGVDYLEAMRLRYWGKRDGWTWYFGLVGGLGALYAIVLGLRGLDWLLALGGSLSLGITVPYFMQKPLARKALFLYAPLSFVRSSAARGTLSSQGGSPAYLYGAMFGTAFVGFLFALAAYNDARNKLAFQLEVPEADLQKLYERTTNPTAQRALVYSLFSGFVPLLGVITLGLGIAGLRRAKLDAWPPIGGRGRAIAAIVISTITTTFWAALLALTVLRR